MLIIFLVCSERLISMGLVEKIQKLADEKDVKFAEVERATGISNGQLRRWNSVSPKAENLQKVADYFNVSTDYLLGRTDNPEPNVKHHDGPGSDLVGYFRLNTAGFDPDETEKIEESLMDYTDFLIQKARERKARKNK